MSDRKILITGSSGQLGNSLVMGLTEYFDVIPTAYKNLRYSYRIIYVPETIGSLAYLSKNLTKMKKNIPTLIVLPDSFSSENSSVPVLLLLHGYGGDYKNWSNHTSLVKRADDFKMMIVCPDGSPNSWYFDSPMKNNSQYETFFIYELIPWIKKNISQFPQSLIEKRNS